jgi:hypothetical protein
LHNHRRAPFYVPCRTRHGVAVATYTDDIRRPRSLATKGRDEHNIIYEAQGPTWTCFAYDKSLRRYSGHHHNTGGTASRASVLRYHASQRHRKSAPESQCSIDGRTQVLWSDSTGTWHLCSRQTEQGLLVSVLARLPLYPCRLAET